MPVKLESVTARTILTRTGGYLGGFDFTLQPYMGCQMTCAYCYVRAMAVQRNNRHGLPWGRWLDAKTNAAELLAKDVARGRVRGKRIFMSSSTDPYTPAERRLRITRAVLEVLAGAHERGEGPAHLVVQTRSPLIERDADLLARLRGAVVAHVTVTTDREDVRRAFEPDTASTARRVATLAALRAAGVPTRATVSPLLPCDPERLARMLDPVADEVIIDDLFEGDGADGKRSKPALAIHAANDWDSWAKRGYHVDAIKVFARVLGARRVLVGQAGFAANLPTPKSSISD